MVGHATTAPSLRRLGFSLLELTVVLGIIALIAGAGMSMATGALNAADRISTQEKLNTIKLAIDSHGKNYGFLPCPAKRDVIPGDTYFGVESRYNGTTAWTAGTQCATTGVPAGFTGVTLNNNAAIGAVPVRSLGLPDSYAADAWGNKFTYAVSYLGSVVGNPIRYANNGNRISVRYGSASYVQGMQRRTIPSTIPPSGSETYGTASSYGASLLRITFHTDSNVTSALNIARTNGYIVSVRGATHKGSTTVAATSGTTVVDTNLPYSGTADTDVVLVWQEPGDEVSYVVVSHGADGRGAIPMDAAAVPANKQCNSATANSAPPPCTDSGTPGCIDRQNCNDDNIFTDSAFNNGTVNPASYFDDYIIWGSNANFRTAVNNNLYTNATTSTCPTGTCELWCAACDLNYPGGVASAPPLFTSSPAGLLTATSGSITTTPVLCRKILTSNATDCKATCIWSGTNTAGRGTTPPYTEAYQKCP